MTRIRDARKQAEVDPAKRVAVILAGGAKTAMLKRQASLIEQLARTEEPQVERKLARKPEQAMALVAGGVEVYLPLAGLLDLAKEQARLADEIAKAQALVERSRRVWTIPTSSRARSQRSCRRSATRWRRRRIRSPDFRRGASNWQADRLRSSRLSLCIGRERSSGSTAMGYSPPVIAAASDSWRIPVRDWCAR